MVLTMIARRVYVTIYFLKKTTFLLRQSMLNMCLDHRRNCKCVLSSMDQYEYAYGV
jgi:hypothetical protein